MSYTVDKGFTPGKEYTIVVVLARPSIHTKDFFNSIKFWTYRVQADNIHMAYIQGPESHQEFTKQTSSGYRVLNWYAFTPEGKEED